MANNIYMAGNYAQPTSAAPVKVTTGTAQKTLLQIATPSTTQIRIIEWGISFDGSAAATPGTIELYNASYAATVTAHVAAGIGAYGNPDQPTSRMTLGTTATGYTASGEGTPGTGFILDTQLVAPTNQYVKQFPLGREPVVAVSRYLRVRVTFGTAINALCYVIWEEI